MAHTLRTSPESGVLARRATARRPPNSWTLAHGFAAAVRAFAVGTALCAAAPAYAQAHRARLSEDLVDNLAAQSQRIDVIVHGDKAEVDALAARYNLTVKRYLKASAVLQVNAGQLAALQQDEAVDHLSGDTIIRSAADVTAETIGADQVWAGASDVKPLTGKGVTVAVIDTGIDTRHAALAGRVIFTKDFTGGDGMDRFGHGTHVAGIIAGAPGRTADTSDYRGIAWGARLVNLRALGDDGSGTTSTVMEAIDWAIDHRGELRIGVINLSLGTPVLQPFRDDPLCEAVERAVAAGIVVVTAAGNQGQSTDGKTVLGSITSPGNSPYALTVGALDTHNTPQRSDDTLAPYSSRGPTRFDLVIKPDVSAPGSHVVSAEASGAYLPTTYPARHVAGSGPDAYMQLSGTSMAAAVVSGAVALLLDQRPGMKVFAVKGTFQVTSSAVGSEGLIAVGAGSLNALAAIVLTSEPNGNSFAPVTLIGGQSVAPRGLLIVPKTDPVARAQTIVWGATIVWGQTIIWGQTVARGETIIWGSLTGDTVAW
ncbi:MAG TPA: S8 family peptidase, partial [Vicinamibacterales bacterium]|nr:S8 family peptidase [Vicinamibacterales bacterium]